MENEPKCPFCGGEVLALPLTCHQFSAQCQNLDCWASGPLRSTEAEALAAFCRVPSAWDVTGAMIEEMVNACVLPDLALDNEEVRSGATFREAVVAAWDEAKARGWIE